MTDAHAPRRPRPPARRRHWPLGVAALILAGGLAWLGATAAVDIVETRAGDAVRASLADAGQGWAEVRTDGLQVILRGTAPSEADRLRALGLAGASVSPGRIIDDTRVARQRAATAPPFGIELLISPDAVSLIGLVPAATDRAMLRRRLAPVAGAEFSDLLTAADHPVPKGWQAALDFGLQVAGVAAQAKITIRPAEVGLAAIAGDPADKERIEMAVRDARPQGVALSLDVRAPLPVITPFALRLVMDAAGARLESCAAGDIAGRDAILTALAAAGVGAGAGAGSGAAGAEPAIDCPLGLGMPNAAWGAAAVRGIEALASLGAGELTLSDSVMRLAVPATVPVAAFETATAGLRADLPAPFRLQASRADPQSIAVPIIEFSASRASAEAPARLRGHVTNDQMRVTVETVARARLGPIDAALRADADTPGGWTVRVIAGVEALAALASGHAVVTPDLVQVEGVSGNADAAGAIIAALGARLGAGARYAVRVDYDRNLDPVLALPDGDQCVTRLNAALDAAALRFAPGAASFEGDTIEAMAGLRDAMQDCTAYRIEIGGHTDSQGSASFNQQLSQARAEAVRAAMAAADIPVDHLRARGYGPSQPVATNDTEAGREQNRRIEMRLIDPEPVITTAPEPGPLLTGLTKAAPTTPATAGPPPPPQIEPGTGAMASSGADPAIGDPPPDATPGAATATGDSGEAPTPPATDDARPQSDPPDTGATFNDDDQGGAVATAPAPPLAEAEAEANDAPNDAAPELAAPDGGANPGGADDDPDPDPDPDPEAADPQRPQRPAG